MTFILTDKSRASIIAIGKARAPREACGLLLCGPPPSLEPLVIEVPNQSLTPETSYEFTSEQARALAKEFVDSGFTVDDVVVWHTHPSGRPGPSSKDLANRIPGVKYLVFTLEGEVQQY